MVRLDGDDGGRGVQRCGALQALLPAPTAGEDQAGLVDEDHLARLGVNGLGLVVGGEPLRTIGKADGEGAAQLARVEGRHRHRVADADQVVCVDQGIDAGDVTLLGQAAQQGLGRAAILGRLHAKAAKSASPGRE